MLESSPTATGLSAQDDARTREARNALAATVAVTEMLAVATSTYFAFAFYHVVVWGGFPGTLSYEAICLGISLFYGSICLADRQYDHLGQERDQEAVRRGAFALALAFVFLLALLFMSGKVGDYSRGTFITQLAFGLTAQIATRTLLWRTLEVPRIRGHWKPRNVLILVFPGVERPMSILQQLSSRQDEILRIYHIDHEHREAQLRAILQENRTARVDAALLLFGSNSMESVAFAADLLSEMPIKIQLLPVGMLDLMPCSRIGHYGQARVFEISSGPDWVIDRFLKRSFDLVVATSAGILLLPVMLVVSLLIKLDSKGPVLFQQIRHGYNNRPIKVLKFRTMVADQQDTEFRQATRGDPRITRLGAILRRTNIDELPQLLNVIRGDMSIVGPRPHAVGHNQMYEGQIARMSRRHNVKPGITGWAQVNGLRGETDTFEKMRARVEHDLYYIDNWSLSFDMRILFMTIFSKKSYMNAY